MNNPFEVIEARLRNIENLILNLDFKHQPQQVDSKEKTERLLNVQESAAFLSLSVPEIYPEGGKGESCLIRRNHYSQREIVFCYLKNHISTASMVSAATGIPQKNICRYKRDLEKAGRLWEKEKKRCEETGFKAWYLTANPKYAPQKDQLNLFGTGASGRDDL